MYACRTFEHSICIYKCTLVELLKWYMRLQMYACRTIEHSICVYKCTRVELLNVVYASTNVRVYNYGTWYMRLQMYACKTIEHGICVYKCTRVELFNIVSFYFYVKVYHSVHISVRSTSLYLYPSIHSFTWPLDNRSFISILSPFLAGPLRLLVQVLKCFV